VTTFFNRQLSERWIGRGQSISCLRHLQIWPSLDIFL
jgi:hypothetical protein